MTRHLLALAASTALVAMPLYAFAAPAASAPAAEAAAPSTDAAATADATSTTAQVAAGQTVKDKTGAAIGEVTEVKIDPSGSKLATIKMGEQTFTVATASLAVQNGAAVINATQAEVQAMIKGAS